MRPFSAVLIGNESLAIQCGRQLLDGGHAVRAVVTRNPEVRLWAEARGLMVVAAGTGLAERLSGLAFDWLLSVANLDILPPAVLALPRRGAVNFHDGPLPRYAGLNAPVWAILNGEVRHGITWHLIEGGVDEGDILVSREIPVTEGETALTLNTKCYAAGMESFAELMAELASDHPRRVRQDLGQRSYFGLDARPEGALDLTATAAGIVRLVRALDHGPYRNPLTTARIVLGGEVVCVAGAEEAEGQGAPGTVLAVGPDRVTLALGQGAVTLTGLTTPEGAPVDPAARVRPGDLAAGAPRDEGALAAAHRAERFWLPRLTDLARPAPVLTPGAAGPVVTLPLPGGIDPDLLAAAFATLVARLGEGGVVDLALALPHVPGVTAPWVPVRLTPEGRLSEAAARLTAARAEARARGPFPADLALRAPGLAPLIPPVAALGEGPQPGAALTLAPGALHADPALVSREQAELMAARIVHMAAHPEVPLADLPLLPEAERALITTGWNATETAFDAAPLHDMIAAQVARTPSARAVVFEDRSLSYAELDARANRIAQALRALGVTRGSLVGLHLKRGPDLIAGALAIWKAGSAYVPLDPAYPADRIALYIEDSGAQVILSEAAIAADLPDHGATVLTVEDPRISAAPALLPEAGARPDDLAYLIFTSGSTGRPKGVMIEHRNVANFFAGMDARLPHDPPGVWLAVTSLSFDISVLELFWTLARGFTVVIAGEEARVMVSQGRIGATGRGMEFSLYYWGNDDGVGRDKYRLLLEGAQFADAHGFCAVWTPERHFHAFGGPYPNPSVTGAAVAAVTRNLSVRAGSCLAPLHHPARIAEEWAVIDNLTNGRAALAVASGWQPDDFVLRPENAPPRNKVAMFRTLDQVRALWRGEAVEFPIAGGGTHALVTQPRPVSQELPVWVTTAGNPETWREAGALGANVLTHLLGQSVAEVADKIALYHQALREAGHDPARFKVTLMLHTFLAETREAAREAAREPMKDYLRSAAGLIKQYAWAFPAFKKPKGVENPMQLDLGSLEAEELEGILDFAFLRYFEDSGLFGTVEDALDRVEELKRIGVDEVACLIDYGIPVSKVLDGLKPLAEVLRRANAGDEVAADDFSIAAQIVRHGVTHLQCTPSMARMLVTNDDARAALSRVKHLMIGGEALPGALVRDLGSATRATIENMYGPTETTIWSTTRSATPGDGVTGIGTPIANTQVYVLDDAMDPLPVGVAGELWIGGAGVARGYWQRPDLTAERFRDDPFRPGNRIYRTGDLVRWRADGTLDFLGRADHQVKIRGYRIELGEIEAALEEAPGVTQAVVMPREDTPGAVQLVAYITGTGTEEALKARLSAALPPHMVPARILRLDAFPLTPNRKVDRNALPAPAVQGRAADPAPRAEPAAPAPSGPACADTVEAIAAIWSRILGVGRVAPKDSFFDLGGHSLLAVQAHRDIREELGVKALSITDIFRFPRLSALAARVDDLAGGTAAPEPAPQPPANMPEPPRGPLVAPPPSDRNAAMVRRRELRLQRLGQR